MISKECSFKPEQETKSLKDYKCVHNALPDSDLCIFHVPKLNSSEKNALTPDKVAEVSSIDKQFQTELDNLMRNYQPKKDLRTFRFPSVKLQKRISDIDLSYAVFSGEIDFSKTIFEKGIMCRHATFEDKVDFEESSFGNKADFAGSEFKGKANFKKARFTNGVNFAGCRFRKCSHFDSSSLAGESSFGGTLFVEHTSFMYVTFDGVIRFNNGKIDDYGHYCFMDETYFNHIVVKDKAVFILDNVDLSKASFVNSDVSKINFSDVRWHKDGYRFALYDEFQKDCDHEKVAENYNQLVINYEGKRNFKMAEHFHIGEMEMYRKQRGRNAKFKFGKYIREWFNSHALYRLLSNYGTSYWQGTIVLLLLIFIFSGIFLLTGIKTTTGDAQQFIEYDLWRDNEHIRASLLQVSSDFWTALLYTLGILTFQKEKFAIAFSEWSYFWTFIAVITLPAQGALLLFALRRRFKR